MARTLQAVRQRIFAALTVPPLAYAINAGPQTLLPATSVVPRTVWDVDDDQPSPYVAFAVAGAESSWPTVERWAGDRELVLTIWVVSSHGITEPTEIYEAARARLNYADQEQISAGLDLSAAATEATLPIAVRYIRETFASEPAFEAESNRWYLSARYKIVAV